MGGQHWRATVLSALALGTLRTAHAAYSLDIEPWTSAHEDGRPVVKRGTIVESVTQKAILYAANISVGTPPQTQLVQVAINSADTLILASNSSYCRAVYSSNCTVSGSFTANDSSTYQYLDSSFTTTYTNGLSAAGDYFVDTVSIGNGTLSQQQLAVAYDTNRAYGVLGLGFAAQEVQALKSGRQYSNVPASMANAGIINSIAYSLWLNSYAAGTGTLLFGGVDLDKFEGNLMTIPLLSRPANSSDVLIPFSGISLAGKDIISNASLTASLDAGSTFTYIPDDAAKEIWAMTGAQHVDGAGVAEIDCSQINNETTFEYTLSGWVKLTVPMSHLVYHFNSTTCLFGITTINDSHFGTDTQLDAILGLTFLVNAYVVYDLSNQEVSLALSKYNVTTSNIVDIQNGVDGVPGAIRTSSAAASTSSASGSGGLSAGASAGIGVGAAAVAILLALGAFLLWRRKRKARKATEEPKSEELADTQVTPADEKKEDVKAPLERRATEMDAEGNEVVEAPDHLSGQHVMHETDGSNRYEVPGSLPVELEGGTPVELEGSAPFKHKR